MLYRKEFDKYEAKATAILKVQNLDEFFGNDSQIVSH
jgi:hypothetical protein